MAEDETALTKKTGPSTTGAGSLHGDRQGVAPQRMVPRDAGDRSPKTNKKLLPVVEDRLLLKSPLSKEKTSEKDKEAR